MPALLISQALAEAALRLAVVSETAALDAQVLLAHLLSRPRAWLLAHLDQPLSHDDWETLENALSRLERGEPLPYLLGHWEFYGLDFLVGPAVLIPRPETEVLVEAALDWLRARPEICAPLAADVGTGSGCIAVALAANVPRLYLVATDRSLPALRLARQNASRHNLLQRITFLQSDLLSPFALPTPDPRPPAYPFHLICANLPYIPTGALEALAVARNEPRLALDGGADGMDLILRLLQQVPGRLAPGGRLLLEIEANQGAEALALARAAFPSAQTRLQRDLAGKDRLVCIDN